MHKLISCFYSVVFSIIPGRLKKRMFIDLARFYKVSSITAESQLGDIRGNINDTSVFLHYFQSGNFSNNLTHFLNKFFEKYKSGTYLDIGANIGLTLIPVARIHGVTAIGFEPEPNNFALLSENIRKNVTSQNVQLHNMALFNEKGELTFELSQSNHGDHRVRVGNSAESSSLYNESSRLTISVPGDRLDKILNASDLKKPLAIKIDTQGAEHNIYLGGRSIIASADVVFMEYWPYGINRMGGNVANLLDMISEDFSYGLIYEDKEEINLANLVPIADLIQKLKQKEMSASLKEWNTDLVLTRVRTV